MPAFSALVMILVCIICVVSCGFMWRKALRLGKERDRAVSLRQEERTGRIRAEKTLKQLQSTMPQVTKTNGKDGGEVVGEQRFRPIGFLKSVYPRRHGTPRQGLMVSHGLASLQLMPHVGPEALVGLEGFSHCWLVFVFNANTNSHKESVKIKACFICSSSLIYNAFVLCRSILQDCKVKQ